MTPNPTPLEYVPETDGKSHPFARPARPFTPAPMLRLIDPVTWQDRPIPERKWLVDGLIPMGVVTMLNGDGGTGKSLLALQLMVASALNRQWIGFDTRACKSFGMFCEDDPDELQRRLARILRHYGADFADLENMMLTSRIGEDNLLMKFRQSDDFGNCTALYELLLQEVRGRGAQLLIIDTAADTFGGNENGRAQVRAFISALGRIALETGAAVLLTAHPSIQGMSSGTGMSGNTGWNNSVRSRLYLKRPDKDEDGDAGGEIDPAIRVLQTMKSNYGAIGGKTKLSWDAGVFIRSDSASGGILDRIEQQKIETLFLECLAQAKATGRTLSDANGANFAPKIIAGMERAKAAGLTKVGAKAAMHRLFDKGRLRVERSGPPSRQVRALVVVERS